jgi:hypothetical protein
MRSASIHTLQIHARLSTGLWHRSAVRVASAITGVAMVVAILVTAILGAAGSEHWDAAFTAVLALLGIRLAAMAWRVARRELPWPRLLLPALVLLAGLGGSLAWEVRIGIGVLLEVAVIVIAIRELRRSTGELPEVRIARGLEALVPERLARLIAFELVIVGCAVRFLAGQQRPASGFTYHRESGLRMLLPILPLLGIGDLLLLELVILPEAATWLRIAVHALAAYSLIWLVGLYASARARPHRVRDGRLELHRGLLRRVEVPVTQIASIAPLPSFADDWKRRAYGKGAIRVDLAGAPILELRLHAPVRSIGVLGDGAPSTRVLVAVDDPDAFVAAVT